MPNRLADPSETPEQLFARCEANAQVAERSTYERALSLVAGELTFPDHLFGPEPLSKSAPPAGEGDSAKLRWIVSQASRYRDLMQWLKEYRGREQRWLLLGLWLKEEGICDPIEFLPAQFYKNLTAEKRAKFRISITDVQHYHQVEAWRPYFERLLAERRGGADLATSGYENRAILATEKSRTAAAAACAWLSELSGGRPDATTFRNAHSRMSRNIEHHKTANRSL